MNWTEVTVRTNTAGADMISELLMSAGAKGTVIEDRHDAAQNLLGSTKWDILDDSILALMDEDVLVRAYLPEDASGPDRVAWIRAALESLTPEAIGFDGGPLALALGSVREEDWAENWKQYYKPFRVGKRLVVKPVWEIFDASETDLVIEIDPGMAFGNGTHETTAMCMALLEKYFRPGMTVLDVGAGSGILALTAARLGAQAVTAVDIDPVAVRVARENIERNGLAGQITAKAGDLLEGIDARADIVVANIIADVIVLLSGAVRGHMMHDGLFICSGIIKDREGDVCRALSAASFTIESVTRQGEWVAIAARG